ncbi:hypothetical protein X772_06765 [Mesorhizobium sp. LSJC280B00]|nr:hypothetical protein X772_06765 [Mesorhizobium sp. LSJC280B00]
MRRCARRSRNRCRPGPSEYAARPPRHGPGSLCRS